MNGKRTRSPFGTRGTRCGSWIALAAVAVSLVITQTGCEWKADEFRATAVPALQSGVNSILDGLVDGVFAVIDPDESANTDTGTG